MKTRTPWLPRLAGIVLILVSAALLVSVFFNDELFPDYSPAQRGAALAGEAGCFSCHGSGDGRGSIHPLAGPEGTEFRTVPSMVAERHSLEELRQWIENGVSDRLSADPSHQEQQRRFALRMPAYQRHLNSFQIDDLMSYVALQQYRVSTGDRPPESRGEQLARRYACFTCHGELGQGGVENPGSLKGYIPGFFGTDFRALTQNGDRRDLREWILDGRSRFFWEQGFAGFHPGRFFTERQAIRMPAYRDLMDEEEVEALVEYLMELMELGPLSASDLLRYRPIQETRVRSESPEGPATP